VKEIKYADFPLNEYQMRVQRVQEAMEQTALDALVITDPANLRYLFGFQNLLQLSATRLFAGVFPREAPEQATLFIPHDCQDAPQSWVENVTFWSAGQEPPFDDRAADIGIVAERIQELGLNEGRLGLELGAGMRLGMPVEQFDRLRALLSKADIIDAAPIWWSVRRIKSEAEIAVLQRITSISAKAINDALEHLHEGITERELYCEVHSRMFAEGADGQSLLGVLFGTEGWRRANMAPTDERVLETGDWVYLDGGGMLQGYSADICRMGVLGKPSGEQQAALDAVEAANEAMIAAIRPGVPCSEIYRVGRAVLEERGWGGAIGSLSMGHGIGLNVHEMPDINLYNDEPLEEGMVIAVEPWMLDRSPTVGLFNREDMVVVRRSGAQVLSE